MPSFVRTYFWRGEVGKVYGDHAHSRGQEIFICISGGVKVILNDGKNESKVLLRENQALFIPTMVWHQVSSLEEKTLMLVLADCEYDREAYYEESFKEFCSKL